MARMTTEQRKRYDLYSGILSRIYQDVNAVGVKGNRIAMQRVFNAGQRRIRAAGFAGDLRSAMTRRYGKYMDRLWAGAYGSQEPPEGKGKAAAGGVAPKRGAGAPPFGFVSWEAYYQNQRRAAAVAIKAENDARKAAGIQPKGPNSPPYGFKTWGDLRANVRRTIAETEKLRLEAAPPKKADAPPFGFESWDAFRENARRAEAERLAIRAPAKKADAAPYGFESWEAWEENVRRTERTQRRIKEEEGWPGTPDVQRAWAQFESRGYDPEFLEPLPEKLLEQMLATHPDMIARAFDHQIKENTDAWYRLWRANPKVMLNAPLLAQQWTAARYGAVANWLRGQGKSVGAPPSYDDYLTSVSSVMARKAIMPSIKMPLARTSARAIVVPEFGKQVLEPPSPLPPPPSDRLTQQMARMPAAGVFASTANLLSYVGEQTRGQGIRPSPAQALTAAMNLASLASKAGHLQPVNYLGVVSDLALLGTATGVISPEAGQRYQSYIGMAMSAYGLKAALTPWLTKGLIATGASKAGAAAIAGPIGWAVAAAAFAAGMISAHKQREKAIAEQEAYQRKLQTARIVGMTPSALRPLSGFQYVQPRRALPLVRGGPSTFGEAARIPYTTARP